MTDTPETDAAQIFLGLNPDEGDYFVPATIARQLEQQRDEAVELYNAAVIGAKLIDKDLKKAEETAERYRLDANAMMMQRDRLEMIACELIAMIRMNVACGKFAECSFEQINEHLKPWIERTQSVKGTQIE